MIEPSLHRNGFFMNPVSLAVVSWEYRDISGMPLGSCVCFWRGKPRRAELPRSSPSLSSLGGERQPHTFSLLLFGINCTLRSSIYSSSWRNKTGLYLLDLRFFAQLTKERAPACSTAARRARGRHAGFGFCITVAVSYTFDCLRLPGS